jgi:hypothetical protein
VIKSRNVRGIGHVALVHEGSEMHKSFDNKENNINNNNNNNNNNNSWI